jgi:tRNA pseudouridine38-40 synthase
VLAAAREILGEPIQLVGASRTDAGVHALRQVASLATMASLDAAALGRALNATLPRDIRVLHAADAAPGFDARRRAAGKRYAYVIDAGPVASPLTRRYAWHVSRPLDAGAMRAALRPLVGRHDFSAFCAAAGREAGPYCHVRAIHVMRRRARLAVLISADRFLHHMVRNIVGSAVAVGRGAKSPEWLRQVLDSRDRRLAGATAPPHGLVLVRVRYAER